MYYKHARLFSREREIRITHIFGNNTVIWPWFCCAYNGIAVSLEKGERERNDEDMMKKKKSRVRANPAHIVRAGSDQWEWTV